MNGWIDRWDKWMNILGYSEWVDVQTARLMYDLILNAEIGVKANLIKHSTNDKLSELLT